MLYREFIIFVGILAVTNCQICCFACYCPSPAEVYVILPNYGPAGGHTGLRASYGPAVNGLCPVGVNIGGQCYA